MPARAPALLSAIVFAAACGHADADDAPAAPAPERPVAVETVPLESVEVPNTLELEGTVHAARRAQLSPEVDGHVQTIHVERGDVVEAGAPLVTLRSRALRLEARSAAAQAEAQRRLITAAGTDEPLPTDQQADVRRARSQAENLRQQVARLEALHARGATDDQTLDDARARLASADATLEAAERAASASLARWEALRANAALLQQRARDAVLRAPFAGAVVARPVEVGEHVGATTTVVELVDASSLRVEVEVPERHAPAVRPGQRARIEVDGYATSLEGEVRFVAAALDPEERTLTVEVLADNPEGAVRAGHFARVSIETGGVTSRWRVPREALRERAGVERLYVVEGDTARAVLVERAGEDGDHALVSGALSAELRVIHPVPASLADGAPVAPTR